MPEKLTIVTVHSPEANLIRFILPSCNRANRFRGRYSKNYRAPGGLLEVPRVNAATVPTATPAPTKAPTLMTIDRVRRCLPGAIAVPAGCEAATPLDGTDSAAAVPTGF